MTVTRSNESTAASSRGRSSAHLTVADVVADLSGPHPGATADLAAVIIEGTTDALGELSAHLADAYAREPAGARVVVAVSGATTTTTRRPGAAPSLRSDLATALFAAGFDRPRFRAAADGLVATAFRGELAPPAERRQTLTVVMPVYNERETFGVVVAQLLDKTLPGMDIDVVIVESNSTDGTREDVIALAEHPRVHVVLEDRPSGKGHAVRAGLAAATGDFVLIQDADLEYDMDDYEAILEPLRRFETGFVLGIRARTDGAKFGVRHFEHEALTSQIMNVGNAVFLALFNVVYRSHLKDPFTMYKVLRRDCLNGMILECNRFDFDWELTAKLLRAGYEPVEVPVSYRSRSFSEGKKISVVRDPLTWIVAAVKYRFARFED